MVETARRSSPETLMWEGSEIFPREAFSGRTRKEFQTFHGDIKPIPWTDDVNHIKWNPANGQETPELQCSVC